MMNPAVSVRIDGPELVLEGLTTSRVYRMLRPDEVRERTTLSSSHLHRLMVAGCFPDYLRIARRACGLPEHVLDAFLAERMAARRGLPPLGLRPSLPPWTFDISKVPARSGIRLIHRYEVLFLASFSKSTLHRLVSMALFPAPVPLGSRAARWVAHEVEAWVRAPSTASLRGGVVQIFPGVSP